jgi:hypothetical protein
MQNETHRCNSTGYRSIHGSSDVKDYVEGVGVGGGGMITLDMYYDGLMRRAVICTDVIQTQPNCRPSLGSQSVVHTVEGHPGGTLSHTVGLLTVFHSQKGDELEPETHTKRQATLHDYLPSLLAVGKKKLK